MGVQVSNCSALAYYPSQRLVTHNMHQSCVRTDFSTTITAFKSWIACERSLRFKGSDATLVHLWDLWHVCDCAIASTVVFCKTFLFKAFR
jgi:hypothetical protein